MGVYERKYGHKSDSEQTISKNKLYAIIILFCILFLFLLSSRVNASQSFGELYQLEDNYITKVLPQTTVKDLRNNLEIDNDTSMQVTDKNGEIKKDNEIVGSGMVLKLAENTYKISVVGDLDGNGRLTISDLVKAQLNLVKVIVLGEEYEKALDVNGDGNKSITDVSKINLSILGILDVTAPNTFVPTATSTMDSITVSGEATDENTGISEYYFKINNEEWVQNEDKTKSIYTFTNLDKNTVYNVKMKVKDGAGNEKITQSIKISTSECNIYICPDTQEWTNEDIQVSVDYSSGIVNTKKLISIDGGNTFEEYQNPVMVGCNTEIVARLENELGEIIAEARKQINNIDKLAPEEFSITATANKNTITIESQTEDNQETLENGSSGIKQYEYIIKRNFWKWSEISEETICTFNNLIEGETYTVQVIAVDNAGNKTASQEVEVKSKTKAMLKVNPNGGIWEGSKEVEEFRQWEGETKNIEDPIREGFTFEGWAVEGEENLEDGIYTYGQKNTTITAQWNQVQFVYVTLYTDGTLGFSNQNDTIEGKDVIMKYGDIYEKEYTFNPDGYKSGGNSTEDYAYVQPWYSNKDRITKVDFASEIIPKSTSCWFFECSNLETISNIQNLNTSRVTNMNWMFSGCESLTELELSTFDTSNVLTVHDMFYHCINLTKLDVSNFDTSNITWMRCMFHECSSLTSIDVSNFDISNVTDVNNLFGDCINLTNLDVSNFDTSSITSMVSMFENCEKLTSIDVSNFDTSNVENIKGMFAGCKELTSIDVSNFNTNNVTNMSNMFGKCENLTSIDVSNFNTNNVTDMSNMFNQCSNLTSIDVSNFDTSNVEYMNHMFSKCNALTNINVSNFDTSNVINMSNMFGQCGNLTSIDVSNFDTSNVTNMSWMFEFNNLTNIDVSNFNTSNVIYMQGMFYGDSCLTSVDVSDFDTGNVKDMSFMFAGCKELTSLDVRNFDTEDVTNMSWMFQHCEKLTNIDVSNFSTSNVTNMRAMFGFTGLTSLDLSNFDTSNVENMKDMFYDCSSLTNLNVSNFDTSNVIDMTGVFQGCSSLTSLDINNFDTSKVTDMHWMFKNCSGLTNLDLSNFNTSNVTTMQHMFYGDSGLTNLDLSSFDTRNVTDMNSMFRDCSNLTTIYVGENWSIASNNAEMFTGCGTSSTTTK